MGVGRTPHKSQQTKLTLEKKTFSPLLPGFELETFRSRVRRSNQQAIPGSLGELVGKILYVTTILLHTILDVLGPGKPSH